MSTMTISKILLPVDFSPRDEGAAKHAAGLARDFGAEVTILHVNPMIAPSMSNGNFGGVIETGWITAMETQRRKELASYFGTMFDGIRVEREVVTGDPGVQIIERARHKRPDLIVMPTHGYGPLRRFLLGSVTAKVLHDATGPVWTGVHLAEFAIPAWISIRRVLCAVDLGPGSECVADWAWRFAMKYGAAMATLHVLPNVDLPDPTWIIGMTESAEERVRALLGSVKADGKVIIGGGDPASAIAKEAERLQADVLVIGRSPAKREPGRLRAGAYSIIRDAPCPVVSI
jgi:nucleotide-binding universal stress UspA family protein